MKKLLKTILCTLLIISNLQVLAQGYEEDSATPPRTSTRPPIDPDLIYLEVGGEFIPFSELEDRERFISDAYSEHSRGVGARIYDATGGTNCSNGAFATANLACDWAFSQTPSLCSLQTSGTTPNYPGGAYGSCLGWHSIPGVLSGIRYSCQANCI